MTYPNESWPADSAVEALDGTTHAATGLPFIAKGTGPTSVPTYEVQYNRRQQRENAILALIRQLQVVDEGGLTVGVYPGAYRLGGADVWFDGATGQVVGDDAVSYVYLDGANALQIVDSGAGWPTDAATFVPLAEVTSVASDIAAIADVRNRVRTHVHGPADLGERLPQVSIAVGAESSDAIDVTLQVQDGGGASAALRAVLRCWIGDAAFGGEATTAPSGGVAVTTGTLLQTVTADKHWLLLTDATGAAVLQVTETGAATFYVMAELDGVVVASAAVTFST